MGKPQKRKRAHKNIKDFKKKHRTRRRAKDVDQIQDEILSEKADQILHQKVDPDLPGGGQFYCIFCARHFMSDKILKDHEKTKNHKKRIKLLKEQPYSQAEAEAAAGMGSYNIRTIKPKTAKLNMAISSLSASMNSPGSVLSTQSSLTSTTNVMETLTIDQE